MGATCVFFKQSVVVKLKCLIVYRLAVLSLRCASAPTAD